MVVASLEMLSGRSKKEYAQEAQSVAAAPDGAPTTNGAATDDLETVVAMRPIGRRVIPSARRPVRGSNQGPLACRAFGLSAVPA